VGNIRLRCASAVAGAHLWDLMPCLLAAGLTAFFQQQRFSFSPLACGDCQPAGDAACGGEYTWLSYIERESRHHLSQWRGSATGLHSQSRPGERDIVGSSTLASIYEPPETALGLARPEPSPYAHVARKVEQLEPNIDVNGGLVGQSRGAQSYSRQVEGQD
jgi:hypothetical protein